MDSEKGQTNLAQFCCFDFTYQLALTILVHPFPGMKMTVGRLSEAMIPMKCRSNWRELSLCRGLWACLPEPVLPKTLELAQILHFKRILSLFDLTLRLGSGPRNASLPWTRI